MPIGVVNGAKFNLLPSVPSFVRVISAIDTKEKQRKFVSGYIVAAFSDICWCGIQRSVAEYQDVLSYCMH